MTATPASPAQLSLSPRAWGALALLSLIWGGSFLSIHVALREIPPLTLVAWRCALAALLLLGWLRLRGLTLPGGRGAWVAFAGMGLLNNVLPFTLITWGQQHIESGLAAILNAATAIVGVLVAAVFFSDERLTWRRAAGVLLGFGGVVIAIGADTLRQLDPRALGQLAVLGATVSYAFAGVWARRYLRGLRAEVAATGMLTAAAAMIVPMALVVDGAPTLRLAPATWAALAYYAVMATVVAYLLYYRVLATAGSGNTMLTTLLVAPVAIVLGAVVLGEALPPHALAGFAVLAAGLVILSRAPKR